VPLSDSLLGCNSDTARRYGDTKNVLRAKGRPIPENDLWIASIAIQHDLTLVTRDAHLRQIEGLRIQLWQGASV
jgi:tRNA(fMet)-specific endonuclease VapC